MNQTTISIRLTQEELQLLTEVVNKKYSPNRSDAIRKAIVGFYGTAQSFESIKRTKSLYKAYLIKIFKKSLNAKQLEIYKQLEEENHDQP